MDVSREPRSGVAFTKCLIQIFEQMRGIVAPFLIDQIKTARFVRRISFCSMHL